MIKRDIDVYINEFYKNPKRALIVTGARQIGKMYAIHYYCYNQVV